jgi:tryptophan-rich sensory protein
MEKNNIKKIIITILSILAVAVLGSIFVNLGMEWFNSLSKPSQWIPNVLIPIVWTCIYIIYTIILSLWITKSRLPLSIIVLLIINGVLNILWCLVFFTLKLTLIGNVVIIINLIMAYYLVLEIKKYNKIYFYFSALYPVWVSIATTLNLALWILN